jgi:hypothetical protein
MVASPLISFRQSLLKPLELDELGGCLREHGRRLARALPLLSGLLGSH